MFHQEGAVSASSTSRKDEIRTIPRRPRVALRLAARLRWFSLDERLMGGEDPSSSELLSAHAARLTSPGIRRAVAGGLAALIQVAEQPARISRVSPERSAVLSNRGTLEDLAAHLESRAPVYSPGVARLERLISDSTGPAFVGDIKALEDELAAARAELRGAAPNPARGAVPDIGATSLAPLSAARSGKLGRRRLARLARRGRPGPAVEPPGFAGGSFSLPDGSWFHGRRESS